MRFRVRERGGYFTPQRKVFGFWINIGPAQETIGQASQIIRGKLKPLEERELRMEGRLAR